MTPELLFIGWVVGAVIWCLVFWDSRRKTPFLTKGTHTPALWGLGGLLTIGVAWAFLSRSETPTPPVQPPVVVLKGGTVTDAAERVEAAEKLEEATEAHDAEHDEATIGPDDPLPDDLVDDLRERGVLEE